MEEEKKKKGTKKIVTIVVAILAILAIAAIVAGVVLSLNNKPENVVEKMLENLKTGDFVKAGEMTTDSQTFLEENKEGEDTLSEETQKLFFDRIEWEIKETKVDGENATVALNITNKDFKQVIEKYFKKIIEVAFSGQEVGNEEFEKYLVEILNSDIPTLTVDSVFNLVKQDGKWLVVADDAFVESLLPEFSKAMKELAQ